MAPAAPTPTITTSVRSVAMSGPPALGLGLHADHRCTREALAAFEIRLSENELRTGKADESPTGEILVPAVDGIREHPFHRVRSERVEERARTGPREAFGLAVFESTDRFILPLGRKPCERFAI